MLATTQRVRHPRALRSMEAHAHRMRYVTLRRTTSPSALAKSRVGQCR